MTGTQIGPKMILYTVLNKKWLNIVTKNPIIYSKVSAELKIKNSLKQIWQLIENLKYNSFKKFFTKYF